MNQQKENMKNTLSLIVSNLEKYGLQHALSLLDFDLSNCSKHKHHSKNHLDKVSTKLKAYHLAHILPKQRDNLLAKKLSEIKSKALKEAMQFSNENFQPQTHVLQ